MKRRMAWVLAVALASLELTLGTGATPAFATQQQICGNGGSGYCMNNWNGANQYVKMYNGGVSHEDFEFIYNITECGGGRVTAVYWGDSSNCPFTTVQADKNYRGDPIGQVEYVPTGQCIGTTSAGTAWMGNCANSSGVGGGTGSTQILLDLGGATGQLINRYWTDYYSSGSEWTPYSLTSGGNPGTYLYMNGYPGTVWGL
jgi:hypothetical protein